MEDNRKKDFDDIDLEDIEDLDDLDLDDLGDIDEEDYDIDLDEKETKKERNHEEDDFETTTDDDAIDVSDLDEEVETHEHRELDDEDFTDFDEDLEESKDVSETKDESENIDNFDDEEDLTADFDEEPKTKKDKEEDLDSDFDIVDFDEEEKEEVEEKDENDEKKHHDDEDEEEEDDAKVVPVKKKSKHDDDEDDEKEHDKEEKKKKKSPVGTIIALVVIIAVVIILLLLKSCGKKTYTVSFDSHGGSTVAEQKIDADGKIVRPEDPTKDGYTFGGWYLDGELFDFDTKVDSNLELEAKWNVIAEAELTGLILDLSELSLLPGGTSKLTVSLEPSNAKEELLVWSSSNPGVATVDQNGNVTAVAVGTTVITVATEDGRYKATCTVTVTTSVIPVNGLTVSPAKLTVGVNETLQLKATVTPTEASNKSVTWSGYDKTIISVDSAGRVKGLKEGKTTITVTTVDGGYTQTVEVEVKFINVTSIKVNPTTLTLLEGAKGKVAATISPSNASNKKVTWKSDDEGVATVDQSGNITAGHEGTTNVTVTTEDGSHVATVVVKVVPPVLAESVEITNKLTVQEGQKLTLTATVSPTDTTDKTVTWKVENVTGEATVKGNVLTAVKPGTVKVTATTTNGKTDTKEITITEKPANYTMVLTALVSKTGTYHYGVLVKKNGVEFTQYRNIKYMNGGVTKWIKGTQVTASDISTSVTKATIFLNDGSQYDITITYDSRAIE